MPRKKTHEEFLEEVKVLVGDEYNVLGEYKNSNTKILFKHNECSHEYEATPSKFLNDRRCPKCSTNHKKTTEQYKKDVYNLVSDEYEVLGEYINSKTKIKIKHKVCEYVYNATPNNFLRGKRCPKCAGRCRTTESFKQEVYNLVGDEYTVLGEYTSALKKIKMRHNTCGFNYNARPNDFLSGKRCSKCNESKGEKIVRRVLEKQQILYKSQYKIKGCRNINSLPFDFAIFNHNKTLNCLIEFDGKQHFEPINHFGGEKGFRKRQHNDQIKNQYCKDNNIKLIRIPYWDFDNIEDILNEELKEVIKSEICTEQAS